MAVFDIMFLFVSLKLLCTVRASDFCPITCKRMPDSYKCCFHGNTVCCQGSAGNDECFIERPLITIEQVVIRDCRMESLSQALLVNISQHPVKRFQLQDVTIVSIGSEPFLDLPNLTNLVLSKTILANVTDMRGALESIQGTENVSITLNNVGIRDEHVRKLFHDSITNRIVSLNLSGNAVETLPLDMFQTWPELKTINCNNNKITNISFGTLPILQNLLLKNNRMGNSSIWKNLGSSLQNLTKLILAGNGIDRLNVLDWQLLPSLKLVDLSNNQIEHLDYYILQQFKQLDSLDLSRNWLSKRSFISETTPVNTVKSINLSRNMFSTFSPWFCKENGTAIFQDLLYLDLSFNLFQYPQAKHWSCLDKLKILNLRSNPIAKLTNNTFSDLKNLETLVLSDNRHGGLGSVEKATFNNTHLKHLDLRWNNLRFFRNPNMLEIFKYTPNLIDLKLSYNKVGNLNQTDIAGLLSPLRKLESLYLQQCNIFGLPDGFLGYFSNLTTLSLEKNSFDSKKLPGLLRNVTNLQNLYMSRNYIRFVEKNTFPPEVRQSIRTLDLSYNPFDCSCDNRWFIDLVHRNSSNVFGQPLVGWPNNYICRTPAKYEHSRDKVLLKDISLDCDHMSAIAVAIITISCFLFVFAISTSVLYRFRWYFIYWRYKWLKEKQCDEEPETEQQPLLRRSYDVCVIYSLKDESVGAFLKNEVNPMMNTLGYKSFIWDRHAGVGPKVSECADSIYGSRNAIVIITNTFLKDQFSKFQLDMALDREMELQREFLTILVHEEVDFKLLSKFWCVRFTKTPTMRWCSDKIDVRRKALEEFIKQRLGEPAGSTQNSVIYRRTET